MTAQMPSDVNKDILFVYGSSSDGNSCQGLYIDGKLVAKNHTLTAIGVLKKLKEYKNININFLEVTRPEYWKKIIVSTLVI